MTEETADRDLVKWAAEHALPFYYTTEDGLPSPCLKIHFGYVTAYFCRGQLTRLWAHADRAFLDDMFEQLMRIFELCGRCRSLVLYEQVQEYWANRLTDCDSPIT